MGLMRVAMRTPHGCDDRTLCAAMCRSHFTRTFLNYTLDGTNWTPLPGEPMVDRCLARGPWPVIARCDPSHEQRAYGPQVRSSTAGRADPSRRPESAPGF